MVLKWDSVEITRRGTWEYREGGEGPSRPVSQQLVQLFFGDGVHDKAEDEEEREEHAQSSTHEGVKTDGFVVSHVGPARTRQRKV